MSEDKYVIDPSDGMLAEVVGLWVVEEKHERLTRYINASRGARKKFADNGRAGFIDLFCGPGRIMVRDTGEFHDGGALAACRIAREEGVPFNQVHIGDIEQNLLDICIKRLESRGENVFPYCGPAGDTSSTVASGIDPYGLYFSYLDPYNLENLPFDTIRNLSKIKRMDMLIHVSVQDLQRNLERYYKAEKSPLDVFCPGWREAVGDRAAFNSSMRAAIHGHWKRLIDECGMAPSKADELVTEGKNQRLYWLVFVSRHDLAEKLWNEIRNLKKQGELRL